MIEYLIEKIVFLLSIAVLTANCLDYKFVPDDSKIFSPCTNREDILDIHGLLDLSNVTLEYSGELVHCEGSLKFVWNVEPTDRIVGYGGVFKYVRGAWQSTTLNMRRDDFCKEMYSKDEFWFKNWFRHVLEEDRKCYNVKGAILRQEPFDISFQFPNIMGPDISGHYKMIINLEAYDTHNRRRPDVICFAVVGDFSKI